ncbi:MAG: acetate kinase [Gemmiger sp.]|nr:acetate kinase [Gemmiger sp.]
MKVLVINCGSSSLKYQLIDMANESVLCKGLCDRIGLAGSTITHSANGSKCKVEMPFPTHTEAFEALVKQMTEGEGKVINDISEVGAIGHRMVHGGEAFKESCLVSDEVMDTMRELAPLAPLHNPACVLGVEAAKKVFGADKPMVAVFDTAFHSTMPAKSYMYALPYEYYEKYHVRRYGFHGTSHRFVSLAAAEYLQKDPSELKIVTCHLGNGSSVAAVDGGKVLDTSMGMTPLSGLIMGTRSGDMDPSIPGYIENATGMTPSEFDDVMNKKSGFLGISGVSSDNRDVCTAAEAGDERAQLALDMLTYQLKKYIGGYAAAMGGLDCVIFCGGIGENNPEARSSVCKDMEFLGISIDEVQNSKRGLDINDITAPDAKTKVLVICTNEELMIARDTKTIVDALGDRI